MGSDFLSDETALIAAVLVLSAALRTSTGFGSALLSAPVLVALVGLMEALSTIVATGVVVDVLVLAADGRRPQPRGRDVPSSSRTGVCSGIPGIELSQAN